MKSEIRRPRVKRMPELKIRKELPRRGVDWQFVVTQNGLLRFGFPLSDFFRASDLGFRNS